MNEKIIYQDLAVPQFLRGAKEELNIFLGFNRSGENLRAAERGVGINED